MDTSALYHHHWLQALSRLCIHLRMRHVGKRDWYREGAEMLVAQQRENGCSSCSVRACGPFSP